MGIPLESLPPKAREQVARKMMKEKTDNQSPLSHGNAVTAPLKGSQGTVRAGKYGNKKEVRQVEGNEIVFDSLKEARRYDELMLRLRAGDIRELKLQPEFTIREAFCTPEGVKVRALRYRADFSYEERVPVLRNTGGSEDEETLWRKVVEDVKSDATKTRVYAIKKKLLIEQYGIIIREI